MNKYIVFAFAVFALIAAGNCGSNYGSSSGYSNVAAPISVYSAPAPRAPAYSAPSSYSSGGVPNLSIQPAYATELFPGQQNYQIYNSAPTYSQVALPVAPSVPVANLLVPAHRSSYGGAAPNYAPY